MNDFKVTERVVDLVKGLYDEGYTGTVEYETSYPSGISDELNGGHSLKLSGFCKENLYLTADADTGDIHTFGRYCSEDREYTREDSLIVVEDIVRTAWFNYKSYKERGYNIPEEFKTLFVKYGFLKEKVVTETIFEEI